MYFKGNLVLQVPFFAIKNVDVLSNDAKKNKKRIMQGVTLLVIAVIFG